jgi:hypothetical protein
MNRKVLNLIAAAERDERGYADVPPGSINDETESELAALGYAIALSDHLWIGGSRVHTPESIQAGNYRPHVSPSIFTCVASRFAHVPDARDFDLEAILEARGELQSN